MILHKGVRRKTTDITDDYGEAYYAQNWRFKRMGEMGRRPGIGKSNMAQLAGPVLSMICGNLYFPYLVQVTSGGNVTSTLNPQGLWNNPVMFRPGGGAGQPAAPVINFISSSPVSPQIYPVGNVTFTPNITYDGLSGPLIYDWPLQLEDPFGLVATILTPINGQTATYNFGAGSLPGNYESLGGFTVTTTIGALSDNEQLFYTVL